MLQKITYQPFLSWEILTLFLEVLAKATNHYTYLMSPKFLGNVICCAQPPDSLTLARKQCLNVTKKITYQPFLSWEILTLFLEVLAKATNYYTYLMSPKFLVYVICCALPPDSMTLARKQYLNATIDARYINAVIWLMQATCPNGAIWLMQDTYPKAGIWLVWATCHSSHY